MAEAGVSHRHSGIGASLGQPVRVPNTRGFIMKIVTIVTGLVAMLNSNEPDKIGQAVSSGCIRMTNQDVIDLYNRVQIGATVIVQ